MQTLGLSDSTPATDNRLKSLFWPSVNTATDVDYLGTQGYWLCTFVAVVTFVFSLIGNQLLFGLLYLMFYYFGGVGVRERSRYAASVVLVMYVAETLLLWKTMLPGTMVFHVILSALAFQSASYLDCVKLESSIRRSSFTSTLERYMGGQDRRPITHVALAQDENPVLHLLRRLHGDDGGYLVYVFHSMKATGC